MSTVIATTSNAGRAMILADTLIEEANQRKLLEEYVRSQMIPEVDYGPIPGTGKWSLLKSGAEKLCSLFRCTPTFTLEEKIENWETGLFHYRFTCQVVNSDGRVVAEGVGSCSTYEKRYRYRNANRVCPQCGKEAIIKGKAEYGGGWLCFKKKDGCGAKFTDNAPEIADQQVGQVQNPEILDCVNTVLKMAKIRALRDAAIALGVCSDLFTQDMEATGAEETHRTPDEPAVSSPPKQRPTQDSEADGWRKKIGECKTLDSLGNLWKEIPREVAMRLVADKDAVKKKLSPPGGQHSSSNPKPSELESYIDSTFGGNGK